jgi:hypothetical protein
MIWLVYLVACLRNSQEEEVEEGLSHREEEGLEEEGLSLLGFSKGTVPLQSIQTP